MKNKRFLSVIALMLAAVTLVGCIGASLPGESLPDPTVESTPSEPTEAVKGKGKSIVAISRKKSRLENRSTVNQVGSMNFQRYFFPLDGDGGVLI